MQIFELHFNPKLKEEKSFDSFIYEPENIYEKKLGNIYMVGELQNTLPQNLNFLDNLAKAIKRNYYNLSLKSPEKALSQGLKVANEFLAAEVKKENVSWLGNLNFAVLSLKDLNLIFTKTGNLKIILLRNGQIIDIGKNLDIQEIEPYPLKVFFNILSGELSQDDIILILTDEVFQFFQQQNLLTKLAQVEKLNPKKIKEILPHSLFVKGEGAKVSGICFISVVKKDIKALKSPIFFQKEKKIPFPKLSWPKRKFPQLKLPKITLKPKTKTKKILILILILISLLFFGFLIFRKTEEKKEGNLRVSLAEIEKKVSQAENFLVFKNEEGANALLKEAWKEISGLTEKEIPLKQKIRESLENLNKLEKIESPEQVSELEYKKPESIISPPKPDFNFDLSVSYLSNFYFLDKKTCKIIKYPYLGNSDWDQPKIWKESDEHCSQPKAMAIDGSIWLLNGDNSIVRYNLGVYQETLVLDFFPFPEDITKIETKAGFPYLYLLEPAQNRVIITDKTGKIIKQFQSEKFDNLTDFAISPGGEIIYLFNNSKIYKVEM